MDLLVSYSWHQFFRAKNEIVHLLHRFGDLEPEVEKSSVWGIAIVHSGLDNRQVIQQCRQLFDAEPQAFQWAVKWLPVDYWCHTDLASIKQTIDEHIKQQIGENQTWGMKVKKRRWGKYHTIEIIHVLAAGIDTKVDLNNPDRLIWVDVVGRRTAVSLLASEDVFTLNLPRL
jgi:tRNA(Ser,Leu) C12 N-acetylase TAN1